MIRDSGVREHLLISPNIIGRIPATARSYIAARPLGIPNVASQRSRITCHLDAYLSHWASILFNLGSCFWVRFFSGENRLKMSGNFCYGSDRLVGIDRLDIRNYSRPLLTMHRSGSSCLLFHLPCKSINQPNVDASGSPTAASPDLFQSPDPEQDMTPTEPSGGELDKSHRRKVICICS